MRLLCSIAYSTITFEANHGAIKACEQARQLHADRTRGQSGHQEGQPDEYALVALLLCLKPNLGAADQEIIEHFLTSHPPKARKATGSWRGSPQLPTMAHEGEAQRLDQEALDVEAAAIIEDLRPMEDSEVLPEGGGVGDLASELAAPTEAAPDTASADACVPAGASTSVGVGSAASSAAAPPQLASAVKVCRVHGMHVFYAQEALLAIQR